MATKPKIRTEFSQPLRVAPGKSVLILYGQPDTVSLRQDAPFSSPSCKRLFNDVVQLAKVPFTDIQQYCILHERCLGRDGDAIFRTEKQLIADDAPKLKDATYTWFKQEYMLSHYHKYIQLLRHILQTLKPSIIVAADKWALFFLSGLEIEYKAIVKSDTGVTSTWRGSHMQLSSYYTTDESGADADWLHVMMPIISIADLFATNANWHTHKLDMARLGSMYANHRNGELSKSITREENFLIPPEQATTEFYETLMLALAQIAASLATSDVPVKLSVDIEHLKKPVFIDCIGIATSAKDAIVVPIYTRNGQSYWSPQQEEDIYFALKYLLEHRNAAIIGQNFNYDSFWLRENLCLNVVCTYDTMTLHHSMFPALEKNLGYLSSMYCEHHLYWKNEIDETKYSSPSERWAYNCKDTTRTFEICQNLLARIEEFRGRNDKLLSAIEFQMKDLHPVVRLVGNRGFNIDNSLKRELHQQLYEAINKLEEQWRIIADAEISSSSPLQLAHFLYKDLGLEVPKVTKASANGMPTSEEAMVALIEQYPLLTPVLQVLLDVRSLRVFQKTFIEAKTSTDGKMRTTYNIDGTDTFRFSSRKLPDDTGANLQNLPKGGKTASGVPLPNVRKLFVPPEGYGVFDTDFDSADLRVVVAESGCKEMQHWLDEGKKPYVEVMKEYYGNPSLTKNDPEYKLFKAFSHASNYLGSAAGIAKRVGLNVHETEKLQKWYFGKFPEIQGWHKRIKAQVDGRGYIENCFGYRFVFYDKGRFTLYQQACAWIPQSTVACLVNRAMVSITKYENPEELRVLLQVHDSLAGLYRLDVDPKPVLKKHMEILLPYPGKHVIIPADAELSEKSWGHCGEKPVKKPEILLTSA